MDSDSDSRQPDLEELIRQVRDLQARVRSLEQRLGGVPAQSPPTEAVDPAADSAVPSLEDTAKIVPVLGQALLGIAGAYLLRALAEFGVLPITAGVAAGILYALFWLVRAARTAPEQRLVAVVHGATSVLILMPLLWETAVRFHAISGWTAGSVLVFFSAFGLAISWRKNLSAIASITTLAGLVTAVALLTATHDLVPFTLALLAMAAAVEFSACLGHWLRLRWIVAFVSDLAVLLLTYFVTRQGGLPEGYAPISSTVALAAQVALLAIYLSSTIVRTLWQGFTVTTFETAQWILAFLLSMSGALRVAHGDPAAVRAVSIFSLVCGAACYVVSFAFLERPGKHDRNFYTYSAFGLLLAFTGSRILVSGTELALVLSALALVCIRIGRQAGRMTLKWHGALYLLLTAAFSGLTAWAAARLLGDEGGWVSPAPAIWISAAAAILGYAAAFRSARSGSWPWTRRLVVLAVAANCTWTVAGLAAGTLVAFCGNLAGSAQIATFCPALRTAVLTALSVVMAWSGTRWQKFELVWLVYPFMAITAYKLVAQDLPQGQTLALFASLFLYGGALVLLPRILQRARREQLTRQ